MAATVADDIAKSTGVNIDRVRGLRGYPLAKEDGNVFVEGTDTPAIGDVPVFDTQTNPAKSRFSHPVPPGWHDIRRYGAIPSLEGGGSQFDCTAAFRAAINAANPTAITNSALAKSGVVYVPPVAPGYECT